MEGIHTFSLELYRWQFDVEEIPALFDNYLIRDVAINKHFVATRGRKS